MSQKDQTLNSLKGVPLEIKVLLGKTSMTVEDLLKCGQGTVIELDQQVGEPVDLMLNGKVIAKGEIVLIGEKIGVTLTEIVE
jgi:flagellar motor switch protein FliN/FliY